MASNRKLTAVSIQVDPRQLTQITDELREIPNGVNRAVVGAINKTLPQGRTVIVNRLFELLTVKKGNIRGRTDVIRATQSKPVGTIRILGRRIGLINFKVKDTRPKSRRGGRAKGSGQGVIAQAYRSGSPERFPFAFIAVGKQGNRQVFERQNKGGTKVPRLPIFSRKGLSLLDVFKQHPDIETESVVKIESIFHEQVASQVDRLLQRRKIDRPE